MVDYVGRRSFIWVSALESLIVLMVVDSGQFVRAKCSGIYERAGSRWE
jgi:hypothetical protein